MDAEGPAADLGTRARRRSRIAPAAGGADPAAPPTRDFIPVELLGPIVTHTRALATTDTPVEAPGDAPPQPVIAAEADEGWANRTSLFGDAEA